jgi:hypothetical protein
MVVGTFAHKLIAYKYAAFLDSDFEAGAFIILDKFFTGELQRKSDLVADLNLSILEFDNKKTTPAIVVAAWSDGSMKSRCC